MTQEPDSMDAASTHCCGKAKRVSTARNANDFSPSSAASRGTGRAYIVFAFLTSLYLVPFMRIMLPHSNEGTLIYGAERIVHGDVFARDFFEVMGPGSFYIVAGFFKLLGETFLATRVWLFCSSLGIAVCLYFLARRVCPRNAILPCLLVAGCWYGMQWPSVSHHVDSDLFSFLSVVSLVVWDERRRPVMLYAAGMCAGLTVWIHQPKGLMLIVALLAWCAWRARAGASVVRTSVRVILGFVAINIAACGYFIRQGALGALVRANLAWPARNYSSINAVPYALGIFTEYWHHWAALQGNLATWSILFATFLIVPFVFVALIPVWLLLSPPGTESRTATPTMVLCVFAGWAVFLSEIHRPDIYHLAFGCPLLLLVCIGLLGRFVRPAMRVLLQSLSIAAACLMISNLLQAVTAQTIPTRVGDVAMFRFGSVLRFIDAHAAPGEQTFFYPYCPDLYFLSRTRNPTRFSVLVYNYNTPAEFDDVITALDQKRVRLVVWDSTFYDRTFEAAFPRQSTVPQTGQVLEPYFRARYWQIADLEGFRILLRKG